MMVPGTSLGNEYFQWRISSQLSINTSNIDIPVSMVKFDPFEEIIWVGSSTGRLASYLQNVGPSGCRYSAWIVSQNAPVTNLEITENTIFTITDTTLRGHTRQGIPVIRHTPTIPKLTSMCQIPGTNNLILAGPQPKLIHYDYVKEKEIRSATIAEEAIRFVKCNGPVTVVADERGQVYIKSSKTCETLHTLNCHGDILDIDMSSNIVVTCGATYNFDYSTRMMNADKYVKMFDLRMNRHLVPLNLLMQPVSVRIVSNGNSERVCVAYQMEPASQKVPHGWIRPSGVRIVELEDLQNYLDLPINSPTIKGFAVSSTKNVMAFGNECGLVTVLSDRDQPVINEDSKDTYFAAPPVQPPVSFSIDDTNHTFGSIPLPFPTGPFLSDWPTEFTEILHRRLKPPCPRVNPKPIHYAFQIENPHHNTPLKKHNIVPYNLEDLPQDGATPEIAPRAPSPHRPRVSKLYRHNPRPIYGRRQGREDDDTLETYKWNVTNHLTLACTYDINTMANTMVQIVYKMAPLRSLVLRHICDKDWCITCELHFLFTAFDAGITTDIKTTNLAWALASNKVSMEKSNIFAGLQKVMSAILRDIDMKSREVSTIDPSPRSPVSITSQLDRVLTCNRCGAMQKKQPENECILQLNYEEGQLATLCQLLEKAIHLGNSWSLRQEKVCEQCRLFSRMDVKRRVRELSPLLLIDTNTTSERFMKFWSDQLMRVERRPGEKDGVPPSPADVKPCKFGADCTRQPLCKFKHGRFDWMAEQNRLAEDSDSPEWLHYLPARISAKIENGMVYFTDISNKPDFNEPGAVIYELEAMIDVIGKGGLGKARPRDWTHPVVLLKEEEKEEWTMVNEYVVSKLHAHEARHLDSRFKLPAFLAYKKKGYKVETKMGKVPEELFFAGDRLSVGKVESPGIRRIEDIPKKGELVGLDCEFIKVETRAFEFDQRCTSVKIVGRASAVHGDGEKIIFDDYVTCPENVTPVDYLTQYSGIIAEDLKPSTSDKFLTSHKRFLLRVLVLLQRGVLFVGHALVNDFGVMNFHIPAIHKIDTVEIWQKETGRMLSLRFLVRELLGEQIQTAAHDSVIDAKYALKVYIRYKEITGTDAMTAMVQKIFTFIHPESPNHSASPLVVYTTAPIAKTFVEEAPRSI